MGKAISKELDRVITEREMKCYHTGKKILPLVENQKNPHQTDRTANHLFR
mgnify:CR=1 FL=1